MCKVDQHCQDAINGHSPNGLRKSIKQKVKNLRIVIEAKKHNEFGEFNYIFRLYNFAEHRLDIILDKFFKPWFFSRKFSRLLQFPAFFEKHRQFLFPEIFFIDIGFDNFQNLLSGLRF